MCLRFLDLSLVGRVCLGVLFSFSSVSVIWELMKSANLLKSVSASCVCLIFVTVWLSFWYLLRRVAMLFSMVFSVAALADLRTVRRWILSSCLVIVLSCACCSICSFLISRSVFSILVFVSSNFLSTSRLCLLLTLKLRAMRSISAALLLICVCTPVFCMVCCFMCVVVDALCAVWMDVVVW